MNHKLKLITRLSLLSYFGIIGNQCYLEWNFTHINNLIKKNKINIIDKFIINYLQLKKLKSDFKYWFNDYKCYKRLYKIESKKNEEVIAKKTLIKQYNIKLVLPKLKLNDSKNVLKLIKEYKKETIKDECDLNKLYSIMNKSYNMLTVLKQCLFIGKDVQISKQDILNFDKKQKTGYYIVN